jgi:CRISPR/Cas system endoribonuclease Cas6 (RAMP superfamily)
MGIVLTDSRGWGRGYKAEVLGAIHGVGCAQMTTLLIKEKRLREALLYPLRFAQCSTKRGALSFCGSCTRRSLYGHVFEPLLNATSKFMTRYYSHFCKRYSLISTSSKLSTISDGRTTYSVTQYTAEGSGSTLRVRLVLVSSKPRAQRTEGEDKPLPSSECGTLLNQLCIEPRAMLP